MILKDKSSYPALTPGFKQCSRGILAGPGFAPWHGAGGAFFVTGHWDFLKTTLKNGCCCCCCCGCCCTAWTERYTLNPTDPSLWPDEFKHKMERDILTNWRESNHYELIKIVVQPNKYGQFKHQKMMVRVRWALEY